MQTEKADRPPRSVVVSKSAAYAISLLLFAMMGVFAYRTTAEFIEDSRWVAHTHEVLEKLEALESNLNSADSVRQGYILTGSPVQLEMFQAVLLNIRPQIEEVRNLTSDNPQQQTRLKVLDPLVSARLQLLMRSVELRQIQTDDAGEQIKLTHEGKERMDHTRIVLGEMKTEERRLLNERREKSAGTTRLTQQTITFGALVAFLLIGLACFLIIRETRNRQQAEQKLKRAYDELEIKIQERTAGLTVSNASLQKEAAMRKQAEQDLRRVNRALRALVECNQILNSGIDETALLNEICRIIAAQGGYRIAWIAFAEHDKEKRVRVAASMGYEAKHLQSAQMTWADEKYGQGPTGTTIRSGRVCITRNIVDDPAYEIWRSAADHRGYASSIALPLLVDGEKPDRQTPALGALSICAAEANAFDAEEIELLTELTKNLAYRISSMRIPVNQPTAGLHLLASAE